jgi:hypothetical protein
MKPETATIQPRSRRRSAHSIGGMADAALHDPRTRVLIRVPLLKTGSDAKAAPIAANAAEAAVSTVASPLVDSRKPIDPPAPLPKIPPPVNQPRSFLRIDAPHATTPTPHTVSPAWSRRADSWLARLPTQPLVWITAIISTAVVVVALLRSGDRGNALQTNSAPTTNSAKRENKTLEHQVPSDSAAAKKPPRDERFAQRAQPTSATKTKKQLRNDRQLSPSPVAGSHTATPAEHPSLLRRAGLNEPAELPPYASWTSNTPVANSTGAVKPDNGAPATKFEVVDGPALGPPPVPATTAPQAAPTSANNQPRTAAGFTGKVEYIEDTIRR